jgi:hypothetical protein
MTSHSVATAPATESNRRRAGALGVPLAVAAAAFGLWWLSDRLLYVGPLDRATFGWAIVIPVWLCVPVAAALAWRGFDAAARARMATALGLIVGSLGSFILWQAVAFPNCQFGAIRGPEAWIAPALVLGAVIGGGLAVSSNVAANRVTDGRRLSALISGAGIQAAFMVVAILVVTGVALTMPACQRPT